MFISQFNPENLAKRNLPLFFSSIDYKELTSPVDVTRSLFSGAIISAIRPWPGSDSNKNFTFSLNSVCLPLGAADQDLDKELCRSLHNHIIAGILTSARLVVSGLVTQAFLDWCRGAASHDQSPVHTLEIVYELPLPSGKTYPFVLKASSLGSESPLDKPKNCSLDDNTVILGLSRQLALASSSGKLPFLTNYLEEYFNDEIYPVAEYAKQISDIDIFNEFQDVWRESVWSYLVKSLNAESGTKQGARNLQMSPEEHALYIKEVIANLRFSSLNPRPDYYDISEKQIEEFLQQYEAKLYGLHVSARKHRQNENADYSRTQRREQLGYNGSYYGFELPIEFQIMDMICDQKKKQEYKAETNQTETAIPENVGRSYDLNFPSIYKVREQLEAKAPKREVIIKVTNSVSGALYEKRGVENVKKIKLKLQDEAFTAADRTYKANQLNEKAHIFTQIKDPLTGLTINATFKGIAQPKIEGLLDFKWLIPTRSEIYRQALEHIDQTMEALTGESGSSIQQKGIKGRLQGWERVLRKSCEKIDLDQQLRSYNALREEIYNDYIPHILLREDLQVMNAYEIEIVDLKIAKFIYIIDADAKVKIARESFSNKGQVFRPTHSQLNNGRAVYGAGELIIGTHNEKLNSFVLWEKFNDSYNDGTPLALIELNNLTGHYRCIGNATLKYAGNVILPALEIQGINIEGVKVEDRLITGVRFSGVSFF